MSASHWISWVCLLTCFLSSTSEEIKTNPGDDILLQCHGPRDGDIKLIRWIRPDLKSQGYVFFFRDEHPYEDNQHPSFHGRVELRTPQIKGGDASVILKNVNIKDTGTYECYVGNKGSSPQLISTITLTVPQPGHNKDEEDKDEEDKDEGNKDEGNKDEGNKTAYVDLVIPAVFTVIGLIIGFCIMKKPSADRPIVYKPI